MAEPFGSHHAAHCAASPSEKATCVNSQLGFCIAIISAFAIADGKS
jgi:hypothetical protein